VPGVRGRVKARTSRKLFQHARNVNTGQSARLRPPVPVDQPE
jgi:hypothetical protein